MGAGLNSELAGRLGVHKSTAHALLGTLAAHDLGFIDTDRFAFRETPDDYLLFLGRLSPDKGAHRAVAVAMEAACTATHATIR